ncbi:MAG: 16S rRNA (uracil(1498)-N(3))-methyltransferase [Vicinamibacterales bacterium]
MPPRFYAPDLDATRGSARLHDDEARHLARVLRLGPGAEVRVFDGRGHEWQAEVQAVSARAADLRLVAPAPAAPEWAVPVTLGLAVLKGDKMDAVVRDAVMLGAHAIRPFVSTRAETSLAMLARAARVERWRRVAVSSAKQCGRAVVPAVHEPVSLASLLTEPPEIPVAARAGGVARFLLVEPSAGAGAGALAARDLLAVPPPASVLVLVGPEGGWTAGEVEAATAAGVRLLQVGRTTLRADAVPLVALTAVGLGLGQL